jgi:hypothetical protein
MSKRATAGAPCRPVRGIVVALTVVLAVLAVTGAEGSVAGAAPSTASAAPPGGVHGVVTGGGSGLAGIDVRVYDATTGVAFRKTTTAADGSFTVAGMAPATVKVRFSDSQALWRLQWFAGASSLATATPIVITDTVVDGIDATLAPITTRVSGHVTAASDATPIGGIDVRISDATTGVLAAKTTTDAQGSYRFVDLPVGTYVIRFSDSTSLWAWQWFDGASSATGSTPVTVAEGTPVVADAALDPGAAIQGLVQDNGTLEGLPGIDVRIYDADTRAVLGKAVTDASGRYFVPNIDLGPDVFAVVKVRVSDRTGTYATSWYALEPSFATANVFSMDFPGVWGHNVPMQLAT